MNDVYSAQKQLKAIIQSLLATPLLAGDIPEADVFDRYLLGNIVPDIELNFDQKLGHLYEDALQALIKTSPHIDLVASHSQVFDTQHQTIGELDFIVRNRATGENIHLELAVKFYLAYEDQSAWIYPGPDARDNWHRKLERMRTHQLVLSQRPETTIALKEQFDIHEITTRQLIYGCLFIPASCPVPPQPDFMNQGKRVGKWLYVKDWQEHFSERDNDTILLIPKALWPIDLSRDHERLLSPLSINALTSLASERCTMFTLKDSLDPWFLVPNDWPNFEARKKNGAAEEI